MTQEEAIAKLKEGSDEAAGSSTYPFITIIEVDNTKEEVKIEGREEPVEVLCKPRWRIVTKENDELVKTPYAEKFGAVVLKVRYTVAKKYEENSTEPNFYSSEFSPAYFSSEEKINLKIEGGDSLKITYKEFKERYDKKYKLTMILYVWHQEQVMKIKLKGASMSAFWDFQKNFKGKNSICAHVISFGVLLDTSKKLKFNKALFTIIDPATIPEGKVDFVKILGVQTELNKALDKFKEKEETIQQELVDDSVDDVVEGEVIAEM